jgi:hypothetical protein
MPRPIKWWNLDIGKEYIIQRNDEPYKYKYNMIFTSLEGPRHFHDFGESESAWFIDKKLKFHIEFDREDTFYDVEEIKENAQKARQRMEHRALNMILKKVVNETFQW